MMGNDTFMLNFSSNQFSFDAQEILNELDILQQAEPVCSTPKANLDYTSFSNATQKVIDDHELKDINKNMKVEEYSTDLNLQVVSPNDMSEEASPVENSKDISDSENSEFESETKEESKSKAVFNKRPDVLNKTSMRAIKRFYHKIFKQDNPKFFKMRLINIPYSQLHFALKRMCVKLFGNSFSNKLPSFLVYFLGLKKINSKNSGKKRNRNASFMVDCMYKYTSKRFSKLNKISEFAFLFNYVYNNHLDELFEAEENTLKRFKNAYKGQLNILHQMLSK